jgi:vancomycin resistance protein YoaR
MVNKQIFPFFRIKPLRNIFSKKRFIVFLIILFIPISTLALYLFYFNNKIYPNVRVVGIPVGGLTVKQAENKLSSNISSPKSITIKGNDQPFTIPLSDINFAYDFENSTHHAFYMYRTGPFKKKLMNRFFSPFREVNLNLIINYDRNKLSKNLSVISEQLSNEPTYPSISLSNEDIVIQKGSTGTNVDQDALQKTISFNLSNAYFNPIPAPMITVDPTITDEEAEIIKEEATNLISKSMILTYEEYEYTITDSQLIKFIGFTKNINEDEVQKLVLVIANELDRKPQNPVFVFNDGKVEEFTPSKKGLSLDKKELANEITKNFEEIINSNDLSISLDIAVITTSPDYETSDINDLGIQELIGRGTSRFRGSIPSRIHNISLASGHFNGTLVAPSETLSFNDTVGDVSILTGYKEAYIIKDGKTVLGDGGGLCQVSTTLFRAALDAGLPITERRAHSYRVAYYEQNSAPGVDATVYSPTTDLKIKNNTPAHILVQTFADTSNSRLTFDIYGTSDGRVSNISKPAVYDVVPPPEDLYVDDPTLPEGSVKQIDWKAWGAKVKFNYEVTRDDETIYEKSFYSNYRPWQSIFLRGTAPVQ